MSDYDRHKGKIVFFPRGSTFYQIDKITDIGNGEEPCFMLDCTLLADGTTGHLWDPGEVGEEFYPIPADYPLARIEAYINAARTKDDAMQLMMDVEHEILLPNRFKHDEQDPDPDDEIPF